MSYTVKHFVLHGNFDLHRFGFEQIRKDFCNTSYPRFARIGRVSEVLNSSTTSRIPYWIDVKWH